MSLLKRDLTLNLKWLNQPKERYFYWRLGYLLVTGVMAASFLFTAVFIYNNIYATLNNAYAIIIINSELGTEMVDATGYHKAVAAIEKKAPPEITTAWRDPFKFQAASTSTTSTKP